MEVKPCKCEPCNRGEQRRTQNSTAESTGKKSPLLTETSSRRATLGHVETHFFFGGGGGGCRKKEGGGETTPEASTTLRVEWYVVNACYNFFFFFFFAKEVSLFRRDK